VAVNRFGEAAVGFSASAPTIFAGSYFTWRAAGDAASSTRTPGLLRAGTDFYVRTFGAGSNRWGDYSGIAVDPEDQLLGLQPARHDPRHADRRRGRPLGHCLREVLRGGIFADGFQNE